METPTEIPTQETLHGLMSVSYTHLDVYKRQHSTCGAIAARNTYDGIVSLMMEYCIAGHHSGIPDGGFSSDSPELLTLQGRMKRDF